MCSHPNGTVDKPWNPCLFPWNGCFCRGTAVFCRGSGYRKKPLNYAPNFGGAKVKWKQAKKGGKRGCIKRENKPSLPINRVCQNSWKINRLWKVREYLYPWNCCPVGFLEMLGKVGLVSERYHPTHPTHPTHRAHVYKWCVRLVCVQVQGTLSSHPTHPPRAWIQVMCSASMCASARYVIIPPPHPTHPVHGYKWCVRLVCVQVQGTLSSHPPHPPHPPRAWVQVILMRPSDPNFWSQVTAKCGHKWPRALWRFCWPCQRMWRFVVVSDRTLWSQVTQILFFCLWSQVTGFCGRKWPPCRHGRHGWWWTVTVSERKYRPSSIQKML